MNILMLTPYIPYPLSEGGKISQFAIIDTLRKEHKLTLILTGLSVEDLNNIGILRSKWVNVKIEVVELGTHEHSVFYRFSTNLYRKVKDFLTQKGRSDLVDDFTNHSLTNIFEPKSIELIKKISQVVSDEDFDLIQVDFLEYLDIVHALPKDIKKVFVNHEIRFARFESSLVSKRIVAGPYEKYILNYVKNRELNLLNLYDAVFTFSNVDRNKLESMLNVPVYSSPFPVLDTSFSVIDRSFLSIQKLVFIGGESHAPNKDAIQWYIDEISNIKGGQRFLLHVIGNWSKETKSKFKHNSNVSFAGYVMDLVDYCRNSILIVPLRIGSGIRTKILYAMAQGVPVISTSVGCEGLDVKDKEHLLIADTSLEFIEAIDCFAASVDVTERIVNNAQKMIYKFYSQKEAASLRTRFLKEIIAK